MPWENSIRIVDEDGDPVERAEVQIFIRQFPIFQYSQSQETDEDGWATFEWEGIDDDSLELQHVFIDGDEIDGGFDIDNGDTRSYSV